MTHAVEPGDWRWGDELDAVVAAPNSHRVVFEDERVRVLEVSVPAGTREPEHTHRWPIVMVTDTRARIRYWIGDRLTYETPDPLPPPGDLVGSRIGPEGPHSVENIDTFAMHALRIEFKE